MKNTFWRSTRFPISKANIETKKRCKISHKRVQRTCVLRTVVQLSVLPRVTPARCSLKSRIKRDFIEVYTWEPGQLCDWLRAERSADRVRFPTCVGNYSLQHHVQIGSGGHPISYPMGTGGCIPTCKAAGT